MHKKTPMSTGTGTPRQATGPPRSSAGLGVGSLRGLWFLRNPKDLKNGLPKNTKIPRGSKLIWKSQRFNKLIVPKDQVATRIQNYLEIPNIQQIYRPKRQRFHADPTLWEIVIIFSKIVLI